MFVFYNGIMLQKFSPLTEDVNKVLSILRAGGWIQHYWNDPLFLEQTFPEEIFTAYDSSKDKLTLEVFSLIFIAWAIGMFAALLALAVEKVVHKAMKNNLFIVS